MSYVVRLLERYRPEIWERQKKDFPNMSETEVVRMYYGNRI